MSERRETWTGRIKRATKRPLYLSDYVLDEDLEPEKKISRFESLVASEITEDVDSAPSTASGTRTFEDIEVDDPEQLIDDLVHRLHSADILISNEVEPQMAPDPVPTPQANTAMEEQMNSMVDAIHSIKNPSNQKT